MDGQQGLRPYIGDYRDINETLLKERMRSSGFSGGNFDMKAQIYFVTRSMSARRVK
jgi:hypothetical protein